MIQTARTNFPSTPLSFRSSSSSSPILGDLSRKSSSSRCSCGSSSPSPARGTAPRRPPVSSLRLSLPRAVASAQPSFCCNSSRSSSSLSSFSLSSSRPFLSARPPWGSTLGLKSKTRVGRQPRGYPAYLFHLHEAGKTICRRCDACPFRLLQREQEELRRLQALLLARKNRERSETREDVKPVQRESPSFLLKHSEERKDVLPGRTENDGQGPSLTSTHLRLGLLCQPMATA
ncbi:hypothetical protein TGME49_327700 [Toxoplasma gondii ME49]|uniref:Uncharacterized protein n=1 Tax=Toxoplasma gondii (strain ATCC 50611 / Me49) TaxID=508771 RepID=S8EQH1_TOXGM|nr:hypothetical protein TGME49_327700 [Toxoplasma gondii ME49]EPT24442.1 hypothetical protein TGME49_327700 [Toxoplasma gondii ME49]|eukprot:XP_018634684.1 hypothetical protein TGME49_327700 [Toxoplasma gondii ME49]